MTNTNRLKMPEDYTELSYEDGELSGSGAQRWTSQDTLELVKQGLEAIGITMVITQITYREEIGNGITGAWNYITDCCSPHEEIPQNNNIEQNNNNNQNNNNQNDVNHNFPTK